MEATSAAKSSTFFSMPSPFSKRTHFTSLILLIQALEENKTAAKPKPEQIIHKMVDGRIGKYYEENCLLQQAFVKENKVSVEAHIKAVAKELGGEIKLVKCVRFEKGEGIEKKVDDFAAEVASMAK